MLKQLTGVGLKQYNHPVVCKHTLVVTGRVISKVNEAFDVT